MMSIKKTVVASAIGLIALSTSAPNASAGFEIVQAKLERKQAPMPSNNFVNVTDEISENARLRSEVERLSAELLTVKRQLNRPAISDSSAMMELENANSRLDFIQSKLEKLSSKIGGNNDLLSPNKGALPTAVAAKNQLSPVPPQALQRPVTNRAQTLPAEMLVTKVNALQFKTSMSFPDEIRSVRDIAGYLLEPINYKIVVPPSKKAETMKILSRLLPRKINDGSVKTIEEALLVASGDDAILIVDHAHKMVTFELIN